MEPMMNVTGILPPKPVDRVRKRTKVRAALWQAVWECDAAGMTYDEIRAFVEGTLHEIESDRP